MEIDYSVVIRIKTPTDPFNLYMKIYNTLIKNTKQVEVVNLYLAKDDPYALEKRFIRGTTKIKEINVEIDTYRDKDTDEQITEIQVIGRDKNKVEEIATEIGKVLLVDDKDSQ